jgi:hypothetical protein
MYLRDLETVYPANIASSLVEDADYLLTYSAVSLAKNLNFFGQLDGYLKELARITLGLKNPSLSQRLEELLSREIAVTGTDKYTSEAVDYAVHQGVMAQARF